MNWSSDENIRIIYRLMSVRGFGPVQTNKLLVSLKPFITDSNQFESCIIKTLKPRDVSAFEQFFDLYQKDGKVGYLSFLDDSSYPTGLKVLLNQNSPTIISYMGNLNLLKTAKVGISGSRKVSDKGLWIAQDIVSQLSYYKICTVSGYANGVDIMAHKTALECGASTIIVLPEGISNFFIRKEIENVWDWNRVLVLSEFLPDDKWLAGRAMKRNMTIIGLSDAMVVVEAGTTGGSLDAGLKTLNCKKTLFVPVFKNTPESAKGNEILLCQGATPLKLKKETHRVNVDGILKTINGKQYKSEMSANRVDELAFGF